MRASWTVLLSNSTYDVTGTQKSTKYDTNMTRTCSAYVDLVFLAELALRV